MFGAGSGARRACACLGHRCRILAFVDNDPVRRGTTFLGQPVIAPSELARFTTERIYVASLYADQIYRQLTVDLAIDPARVVIVRKPVLEGAYEVSPWTYAVLGAIATLLLVGLGSLGVAVMRVVAGR